MNKIEFREIEGKQLNAPCGNFWTAVGAGIAAAGAGAAIAGAVLT